MTLRTRLTAVLGAVAFAAAGPAAAREPMTEQQMEAARGGILLAGGLAFEFGAVMKTYEDGKLALQTQINWTPSGPQVAQTLGPDVSKINDSFVTGSAAGLNPALAAAIGGPQSIYQTGSGATVMQQVGADQLVNLVMNGGSNHDFRADTALTLVLPGFAATQAGMAQSLTALRVGQEINQVMSTLGR